MSDADAAVVGFAANPGVSERAKQNKFYQLRAIKVLGLGENNPKAYRWLWNMNSAAGNAKTRWTILAELGRINDDGLLRRNARHICEHRMKTAEALTLLRRARVGKAKEPDAVELANLIINAVNGYLGRRGPVERETLKRALSLVAGQYGVNLEGDGDS